MIDGQIRFTMMVLACALVALGLAGCQSAPEKVTDTGFIGTWQRANSNLSRFSLRREGEGYRFNWQIEHGPRKVECDDDGLCSEYFDGKVLYQWQFTVRTPEEGSGLIVERRGIPVGPETTPLTEVDHLELEPGGLAIKALTVERNGETLETPVRFEYTKVSDRPI